MAGVDEVDIYDDLASGVRDDAAGLDSCRRTARKGDVLIVWKLDALGRNLAQLVDIVQDLSVLVEVVRVLAGDGAQVDTTTAADRLAFDIFATPAEFKQEDLVVAGRVGCEARGRGYADAGFGRDAAPCEMRSSRNSLASRRLANAAEVVHSSSWSVAS